MCCYLTENFVYMTPELKSDMIVKHLLTVVCVTCCENEHWNEGSFYFHFSFVISTKFETFLVIFCTLGGLHYGYLQDYKNSVQLQMCKSWHMLDQDQSF